MGDDPITLGSDDAQTVPLRGRLIDQLLFAELSFHRDTSCVGRSLRIVTVNRA
jgi:hypothetical protein